MSGMSDTTPPTSGYLVPEQPGGSPARPGTVTIATFLLYLLALLSIVSAALNIYTASLQDKAKLLAIFLDGGYPQDQAEASATLAPVTYYAGAAVSVLLAILYVVLAVFVGKGKQWARITTWVVSGLGICCGLLGLAAMGFEGALTGMTDTGGIDVEKVLEGQAALLPGWLTPATNAVSIASLLLSIAVVVLLLLPPSHPFFRKPEPEWTPPAYPAP